MAIGCPAGSGGKEKRFGTPPGNAQDRKPGRRWHESHHMVLATSARGRPAGTCCWRRPHLTAAEAPPGPFRKDLGETEAPEDELLAERACGDPRMWRVLVSSRLNELHADLHFPQVRMLLCVFTVQQGTGAARVPLVPTPIPSCGSTLATSSAPNAITSGEGSR